MRTMLLILFFILTTVVMAQEGLRTKPRAVEPIRVSVAVSGSEAAELRRHVLKELQKLRSVAITEQRVGVHVQLAGATFQGDCRGVVVAVLTTTPNGSDLQALAGADWQEVARYLAARIKEDVNREK